MSPVVAYIINTGLANGAFEKVIRTSFRNVHFFVSADVCMNIVVML